MSVSSVGASGASALGLVAAAGQAPDPQAQKAQVNAQANLLQAVRGVDLSLKMVAAGISDKIANEKQGVDLYA